MKLIKCHINGFGSIINKDFIFDNNLFEVCEDNGAGKSTLAYFIEAMFYGMDTIKKNSTDFMPRKHYEPFVGKAYGGTLTFSNNEKTYRIEKTFDNDSAAKDKVTIYCNETKTDEFEDPKAIGKNVFGIDKLSFEKLLFINSDKIEINTNSDINKKLNNDINDLDENFDLAKALKKLNDATPKDKEIATKRQNLKDKKKELKNLEEIEKGLDSKYIKSDNNRKEIENVDAELKLANKNAYLNANYASYNKYLNEIKELEEKNESILKRFNGVVPSIDELDIIEGDLNKVNSLDIQKGTLKLNDSEKGKLYSFKEEFKDGIPSNEELNKVEEDISRINILEHNLNDVTDDYDLPDIFKNNKVNDEIIKDLDNKAENIKALRNTPTTEVVVNKSKSKLPILIVIFGLLLIAGLVLIIVKPIIGIIVLISINKNKSTNTVVQTSNNTLLSDKEFELKSELSKYGYFDDDALIGLNNLKHAYEDYKKESALLQSKEEERNNNTKELENLKESILLFLNKYNEEVYNSFSNRLNKIRNDITEYNGLLDRQKSLSTQSEELDSNHKEVAESIKAFETKHNVNFHIDKMSDLKIEANSYYNNLKDIKSKKAEAENFKNNNEVPNYELDVDEEKISELEGNKKELLELKSNLDREIKADEDQVNDIESIEQDIEDLEKEISNLEKKQAIYKNTIEFLKASEQNLKDKYIKPIKDDFIKYSDIIKDVIGKNIFMDKDYNISYEKDGMQRNVEHLSSGEISVVSLAFRLALIDHMYNNDFPFIVMDDPFVHLDENNMNNVRKMMNELAKSRQFIYFTCDRNRLLNR